MQLRCASSTLLPLRIAETHDEHRQMSGTSTERKGLGGNKIAVRVRLDCTGDSLEHETGKQLTFRRIKGFWHYHPKILQFVASVLVPATRAGAFLTHHALEASKPTGRQQKHNRGVRETKCDESGSGQ